MELDLTEAIEAGKVAALAEYHARVGALTTTTGPANTEAYGEAAVRAAAPIVERAVRERDEAKIKHLSDEVAFWKEQQGLAANVAATIADLDEVAPALRQLLRAETKRRRQAEDEVDRLLRLVDPQAAGVISEAAPDA